MDHVAYPKRQFEGARLLLTILLCAGCAGGGLSSPTPLALRDVPVSFTSIADSVGHDALMDSLVSPFRAVLSDQMDRVVGRARGVLEKAQPEGTLGNFAADAMLWRARQLESARVDVAVTNNGGLRIPIPTGPITVGKIYELAPFENFLSILELDGVQMLALADDIAAIGGEPVAGLTFHIDGTTGRAGDVRIAGALIQPTQQYRLVTLDYLIDGGGAMRTLWNPKTRRNTDVLLRDAIIAYVGAKGEIVPRLEDRIIRVERER